MPLHPFMTFSKPNRRLILLLIGSHLLWSCALLGLWSGGRLIEAASPWLPAAFIALQLYAAAQLLLPALLLHPEERSRGFYLFWATTLALAVWLTSLPTPVGFWQPLLAATRSGLLLFVATVTGAALARYVHRLWEILPVCLVMTLADFVSWRHGPTAGFTREIERYYLASEGPAPLVDMILVKLAFPGVAALAPLFGISDWIMVVFFATVARRHGVNDNLLATAGETVARQGRLGFYLPVPVAALFAATVLAQATGLFVPALPVIALVMLLWYGVRFFAGRVKASSG